MNLLILPSWYDTPNNQIRGIFFKEQAQSLSSYFKKNNINVKITILALQQYNIKELNIYKGIKKITVSNEDGITTIRARLFHIPKVNELNFRRGAYYLKKLIKYTEKKTDQKFDLIHIHSFQYCGIWYVLSGLNIPYVITEHSSSFFRNTINNKEKKYLPLVYDNAKDVIAVGNGLANKIQKYSQKKVKVIFNQVKDVASLNFKLIEKTENFIFFSLGYDIKVKGFDILLNAFAKFLKKETGSLIIGGLTDANQEILKKQIELLGIKNNVILKGRIPHNEVYKTMNEANCFVLPSRYETFGIVLAESMYVGRPVIATKTGGPDSFVTKKTGILIEPDNEEQLVNALLDMKNNYSLYKQSDIRKYALETFTADVICDKIYNIYRTIFEND